MPQAPSLNDVCITMSHLDKAPSVFNLGIWLDSKHVQIMTYNYGGVWGFDVGCGGCDFVALANFESTAQQKLTWLVKIWSSNSKNCWSTWARMKVCLPSDTLIIIYIPHYACTVPFLPICNGLHPKWHQACQKPTTLPTSRFWYLSSDIYFNLACWYLELHKDVWFFPSPSTFPTHLLISLFYLFTTLAIDWHCLDQHTMTSCPLIPQTPYSQQPSPATTNMCSNGHSSEEMCHAVVTTKMHCHLSE